MNLTKPPKRANAPGDDPLSGAAGEDEEAQGGIANMRVVNASKVTMVAMSVRLPTCFSQFFLRFSDC